MFELKVYIKIIFVSVPKIKTLNLKEFTANIA